MKVQNYLIDIFENAEKPSRGMLDVTKFILASIFNTSIVDVQDLAETILDEDMKQ